jgi:hypothetical protein
LPQLQFRVFTEMHYSYDARVCPDCKHNLFIIEFAGFHKYIYTIDLLTAPDIVKNIFATLKTKKYIDAHNELKEFFLIIRNIDE